jgi:hypothetical protein
MKESLTKEENGKKYDSNKLEWDLLPIDALCVIIMVFMFGAKKYGKRNWENGMDWSRMYNAACRHMTKWYVGQTFDEETGINHLAHAIVSLMMVLSYQIRNIGVDDRNIKNSALAANQIYTKK